MRIIILIITVLFCFNASAQMNMTAVNVGNVEMFYPVRYGPLIPLDSFNKYINPILDEMEIENDTTPIPKRQVDSTQFIKLLSLKDLQEITQSLKDKMTVTEWEKVTQAIDKVYFARRQEYLKSKDTAKTK